MPRIETRAFPTLLGLLQSHFKGHTVIEDKDKFYLDEVKPGNEIFTDVRGTEELRSRYAFAHGGMQLATLCLKVMEKKPDAAGGETVRQHHARELAELRELAKGNFSHFAPPFHRCLECGYVEGTPGFRHEDTIGAQPLCGHRGLVIVCHRCGTNLGIDPDGLHTLALAGG